MTPFPSSVVGVWSVPHTGTNTMLALLRKAPSYAKTVHMAQPRKAGNWLSVPAGAGQTTVLWDHVSDTTMPIISALLAAGVPGIVPVRDPLLAMISAYSRKTSGHSGAWRHMISMLEWPDLVVMPIDLVSRQSRSARCSILNSAYQWLRLPLPLAGSEIPVENHAPESELLQDAYSQRDLRAIERVIPEQVSTLRSMQSELRPSLEAIGYEKLIWWT